MPENTAYTLTQNQGQQTPAKVTGKVVYGATAIVTADYTEIDLGFRPEYVEWWNATDRVAVRWFAGMADNTCLKTAAAGTQTLETVNGGITPTARGFQISQNATLGAILASKDCYYIAQGC